MGYVDSAVRPFDHVSCDAAQLEPATKTQARGCAVDRDPAGGNHLGYGFF
jgi:hypothetical protein